MFDNGTFKIPPDATGTPDNNVAQTAALVYRMIQDNELPTIQSRKVKSKDIIKAIKHLKGKKRKKFAKKLRPMLEKPKKKKGKKKSKKNHRSETSSLISDFLSEAGSTALRITEKYWEGQFPQKDTKSN